ncbi:hypothetical protein DL764_003070 [Monosporascus ibericus]|uniref:Uncharacterized protein n=1 Tax=Monosporascus ibericus TaxID=155417 RepID=A0A4Q4TJ69_9PEZI|nr:hypothetical protein DL764_003070 [Monosporascus ibericus]
MASTSMSAAPAPAEDLRGLVGQYAKYEGRCLMAQRILESLVRDDSSPAAFEQHRQTFERMGEESQQARDASKKRLLDGFRTKMALDIFFRDDSLQGWFNVLWTSAQEDLFENRDISATGYTAGELARIIGPLERTFANPHSFKIIVDGLMKPFEQEDAVRSQLKKLWQQRMEYRVREELYVVASQHASHDELVDARYWIREVATTLNRINQEMGAKYGNVAGDVALWIENDVVNMFAEQWPRFMELPAPVSDEPRWQYAQLKRDFPRFAREHLDVTEQQLVAYINTIWESQR